MIQRKSLLIQIKALPFWQGHPAPTARRTLQGRSQIMDRTMSMTRLFSAAPLSSLEDEVREALDDAIDSLPLARLHRDPLDVEPMIDALLPRPARLLRDQTRFSVEEAPVKTRDLLSRPRTRDGVRVVLRTPFEGDGRFLDLTAAPGLDSLPEGRVDGQTLVLSLATLAQDPARIAAEVGRLLDEVEILLTHQAHTVEGWRGSLTQAATSAILDRRERVEAAEATALALEAAGFRRTSD